MFTALLIAILVVAGAATVVGGGLVLAGQRRRGLEAGEAPRQLPAASGGPLLERKVDDLRVGDVIQTEGRDFLVEGVLRYDEAGHRWLGARLMDVDDERWLVVGLERQGSRSMRLYAHDDGTELSGYPPELLVMGGHRYAFEKRGTATARLFGDVGSLRARGEGGEGSVERCRWWHYEAAGDDCALVEQWGDDYRVLRGRRVSEADFEMIPGS